MIRHSACALPCRSFRTVGSDISMIAQPSLSKQSAVVLGRGQLFYQHHVARSYNTETVSYLSHASAKRTVYLVGTAHVSSESAKDVANTIELSQPDTVMVELCAARAKRLRSGTKSPNLQNLVEGLVGKLLGRSTGQNFGSEFMLKAGLSGMYSVLRFYGLEPGAEFKTALEEADRRKLAVCLGDRDVDETISLLRAALPPLSQFASAPEPPPELRKMTEKSVFSNFTESIESLKNRKQISVARKYMQGIAPNVIKVMVDQRDKLMVDKLLNECKPGCIVAVVGMAHMDGIEKEWERRGGEVFLHNDNSLKTGWSPGTKTYS